MSTIPDGFGNQPISGKGCSLCGCWGEKMYIPGTYQARVMEIFDIYGERSLCQICRQFGASKAIPEDVLRKLVLKI